MKLGLPPIVLGSQSPRRQELLRQMGLDFKVVVRATDERATSPDPDLAVRAIVAAKLAAYDDLRQERLLICADTVVVLGEAILGKPRDLDEARRMLSQLSDRRHRVLTAVALGYGAKTTTFVEKTDVFFRRLEVDEVEHYLRTASPLDKAGAYGIQDWLGLVGIARIEGDYYNVMGLPCARLWQELQAFKI